MPSYNSQMLSIRRLARRFAWLAAIALASAASCPTGTGTATIAQPTLYNLYPSQPAVAEAPVSFLQIQRYQNQSVFEQAAVFSGIPAGATSCTLGWRQAAPAERHFIVVGSALIAALQLQGFPPASGSPSGPVVSYASVEPFEKATNATALHPDFTAWDKVAEAQGHIAGTVACAEEIYLKLSLDGRNGDGHLYFNQDEKNGFYVTFTC